MSSVCADQQQHKLHPSHQLFSPKKLLNNIDIPPRKLLSTRRLLQEPDMYFSDEALFQKFLPYNNNSNIIDEDDDDSDSDPYSSDHFRIYEFKVRRCTRSRSHDWTDCPFAHPGEKARRRDPRRFNYSGQVCPEYRRGSCSRGDNCEFAHGVFECWLHPARYRTEACKDGKNCKRKVCFFAHTPRQLRVLPLNSSPPELSCKKKLFNNSSSSVSNHCCLFCHCANSSPTSTLLGRSHLSPPLSPPLSPANHHSLNGFSPISRYSDRFVSSESSAPHNLNHGVQSYKDVLTELMSSLDAMNFSETSSPLSAKSPNVPCLDVSFNNIEDQQQFILSPSTPSPSKSANFFSGDCSSKSLFSEENNNNINNHEYKVNENGCSCSDPDLGWVNELLM
uniref:C3H1-type domain-containing protein n=1 Tax=Fagus sylvatica TaxID=28930 RepID=A0A2N9G7S1_FAGSY